MDGIPSVASFKFCLSLALLLLMVEPGWSGQANPQDPLQVVVAFPRDVPPGYLVKAGNSPDGFAFEAMEEVARRAGLSTSYLVVDTLAEAQKALREGLAQIIPVLSISPARRDAFDFSLPLMNADVSVFVLRDSHVISEEGRLPAKTGVVAETTAEEVLRQKGFYPSSRYATYPEALVALLSGQVEAVVGQEGAFTCLARKSRVDNLITKTGEPVLRTYRAMAVAKGNRALLARIDGELDKFVVSAEYRSMYAKWFGEPPPFWTRARLLWAMIGLLILALVAMAAWRLHSLRAVNDLLRRSNLDLDRAKALAQAKAEELQLVLDTVPASIWFKDSENRFLRVNQEAARQLGLPQERIEGRHARDIFPAWLADKYHQDDLEVMARLKPKLGIEEQYTRADGSLGWMSTHKAPWQDPEGERFGVVAMAVDITLRKEAEQRQRESEDRFRDMAEMLPTAICEVDSDLRLTFLNEAGMQILGLSREDLDRGVRMPELIHPDELPIALARDQALLRGEKLSPQEYRLVSGNSQERAVLVSGRLLRRDGMHTGFIFTVTDLTERKTMEEALLQSKADLEGKVNERTAELARINQDLQKEVALRYSSEKDLERALSAISAAFQSTADGIAIIDGQGRISFYNQLFHQMWSLPASVTDARDTEAALDWVLAQLNQPRALLNQVSQALRQPEGEITFTLELKDDRVFEVLSLPQRLRGEIIGRVWSFRDATSRLEAQRALRRSEERHRQVVDNAQEAIVVVREGALAFFNPQATVLTGLGSAQLHGLALEKLIHQDDRAMFAEAQDSQANVGCEPGLIQFRLSDNKGGWKWVESKSVPIEWEGRHATLHLLNEVTERKKADLALRESMQILSATLAASPVGIGFVKSRTLQWANAAMYELLQYEEEELTGQPATLIYNSAEEYRRVGDMAYGRLGGSKTVSLDTTFRRKDGSLVDVYVQFRQLDPQDASKGVIAAVIDISQRKRHEEALLDYQEQLRRLINEVSVAEERERHRIASDLHDGLGQDLALVCIKLASILGSPRRPAKSAVREILAMADKAFQHAKALTWDLSAPMLNELGLDPALDWLAEQTQANYGIPTTFALMGSSPELDRTQADSLFRMTRELVMNAVRHASCGKIKISLTCGGQSLTLAVEDDGAGFDASSLQNGRGCKGFGLCHIRGMIHSWGGVSEIESRPGLGTMVRLTTPLMAFS